MSTDQQIEQEIQDKGKTAPRVTPAAIEAAIVSEYYFTGQEGIYGNAAFQASGNTEVEEVEYQISAPLGLLTFCVLVLRNGFTVTGESACASPENFDAEIGRKIARSNAVQKIWPLEGYLLKQRLHDTPPAPAPLAVPPVTGAGVLHRGTKDVLAWPMSRGDYNAYRGWQVPADEDPADAGFLVEYIDGGKANHPNHPGYISWSPADVFTRAYQTVQGHTDAG
jgi:hypothetical protein